MKKMLLTVIVSLAVTVAFAQSSSPKLSIGPEVGLPLGDARQLYTIGAGGSLKLEVPVSNSGFAFTATAGYVNYFGKKNRYTYYNSYDNHAYSTSYREPNVAFIPIKIGGKYYANHIFYVEGEVGIANNLSSNGNGTSFAYAPGIGVSIPTPMKNAFDIGLRYEDWTKDGGNFNQLMLRIAYKFNRLRF